MRITFICGSLEPGRDGVGDYTIRLAVELIKQRHQINILALSDNYITNDIIGTQQVEGIEISSLRLPASWNADIRFEQAKRWIDLFNPNIISLQYVIFAFHPKGLPYGLNNLLFRLGRDREWHIMFHELWVGMAENDVLKRKIWGLAQRGLIKSLIKRVKPRLIHTQCTLYQKKLELENYNVKKLPLFSNIENVEPNKEFSNLKSFGDIDIFANSKTVKFILFGGLHPEMQLEELIQELKAFYDKSSDSFEFLYVGRSGTQLEQHLEILNDEQVKYKVFGELDPHEISQLLTLSNFGVSTGSPQMLEKNGTVAAMLAHKLPVVCIGRNMILSKDIDIPMMNGTYLLRDIKNMLSFPPIISSHHTVSEVAHKYITDLITAQ